jgi:hypothetical protein
MYLISDKKLRLRITVSQDSDDMMGMMNDSCSCYGGISICDSGVMYTNCFLSRCNLLPTYLNVHTLKRLFSWPDQEGRYYQIYHQQANDCAFFEVDLNSKYLKYQ